MRVLVLLLILGNVCFWFWSQYIDVPESRPVTSGVAATTRTPQLMLAQERGDTANSSSAASVAVSDGSTATQALSCISVGPFGETEQAEQVSRQLTQAGYDVAERQAQSEVFAGYWVSLPSFATRAEAEQVLNQLHSAGVSDAYILPDTNPPNVLSLGLFSEMRRAEQRRDDIAKLGFAPVVSNRTRQGTVTWLDVNLLQPGQWPEPELLQPQGGGIVRLETGTCPATVTAAAN